MSFRAVSIVAWITNQNQQKNVIKGGNIFLNGDSRNTMVIGKKKPCL